MVCVYLKNCIINVSLDVTNVGSRVYYSYYTFSFLNIMFLSISNKEKKITMSISYKTIIFRVLLTSI